LNIKILFDTGSGNKTRLLDISKLARDFTPPYCDALLALHAFTRCDTTSAFKGISKVKPIKLLEKTPRLQEVFSAVGQSWAVSEDLFLQLEEFTCKMYKQKTVRVVEINELRCAMLTQKRGGTLQAIDHKKSVDLSTLPPPKTCLREHIKRVNYQVAIWKRAHIQNPEVPSPTDDNG